MHEHNHYDAQQITCIQYKRIICWGTWNTKRYKPKWVHQRMGRSRVTNTYALYVEMVSQDHNTVKVNWFPQITFKYDSYPYTSMCIIIEY